jgi:hypothetical protein
VRAQLGRRPREPWRVAAVCQHSHPTVIASPSRLADGTPFPTHLWLTCPWLSACAAAEESSGAAAERAERARRDAAHRERIADADRALRASRARESAEGDACPDVGIAGQRDPLAGKCLHARVALALVGIDDPLGRALLDDVGEACDDRRCDALAAAAGEAR